MNKLKFLHFQSSHNRSVSSAKVFCLAVCRRCLNLNEEDLLDDPLLRRFVFGDRTFRKRRSTSAVPMIGAGRLERANFSRFSDVYSGNNSRRTDRPPAVASEGGARSAQPKIFLSEHFLHGKLATIHLRDESHFREKCQRPFGTRSDPSTVPALASVTQLARNTTHNQPRTGFAQSGQFLSPPPTSRPFPLKHRL